MDMYYMNDAVIGLPEAAVTDRTVTEIRFAAAESASLSLTVHRRPLPAGEGLGALVDASVREADLSLPAHAVLFRREVEIAGSPALEIAAQWRGEESMIYTRQAHLAVGGAWLVFAGNAPLGARARCDALMDRVTATFRLRVEDQPPT